MTWNYAAFRTRYNLRYNGEDHFEEVFDVREIYYDEAGNITACTKEGVRPLGDTQEELMGDLEKMLKDVHARCFTHHDVPGYTFDEDNLEVPIPAEEIPCRYTL